MWAKEIGAALICTMLGAAGAAPAQEEEVPDMEFLEYLGLWEGSDADWLLINEPLKADTEDNKRIDPVPDGEESTENEDEG